MNSRTQFHEPPAITAKTMVRISRYARGRTRLRGRRASIACLMTALLVILPGPSRAQERIRFDHISLGHGLSQSIVRAILQDHKGFMWFATQDGLNKYDGYNFTIYKTDPFDSTSLSSSDIFYVYEAPSEPDALWIGTSGGLNRLDRASETFTHFRHDPRDPHSLGDDFVGWIHEDSEGYLWVGTGAGMDRLDRESGRFIHYRHSPNDIGSLSNDHVTVFHEDQVGTIWFGTPMGLDRFDRGTESFTHYRHDPKNPTSLRYDYVLAIFESPKEPGILWIGTGNPQNLKEGGGLNRFDSTTGTFTSYRHDPNDPHSISSDIVGPIHEDRRGRIWIGSFGLNSFDRDSGVFTTYLPDPGNPESLSNAVADIFEDHQGKLWIRTLAGDGVYRFDPERGTFTHCQHDLKDPQSLSVDLVHSIYEDRSGVLWFGTEVGGLNKLDLYAEKFTTYAPDPYDRNSLSNPIVRAIYEDRSGSLWVGVANGGLNRMDRGAGGFVHYRHDPKRSNSLSNDNVWVIFQDCSDVLWIGTFGGGLNKLVPGDVGRSPQIARFTRFRHDPDDPNSLSNDIVRAIYESPNEPGILWIGTEGGGLNRFDVAHEKFTSYQHDPNDTTSLSHNAVRAIYEDASGTLWIGTAGGGLNRFDRENGVFTRYRHDPENRNTLGGDVVQAIQGDASGTLWIGTYGGGLNRFDPATGMFTVYTERNSGLCNNVVYGMLPDDHGNLWLSTNGGICKFNPASNTFQVYDVDDGLQSREFNGQAYFKSPSGEMFFGGIRGLNAFYPDSIKDNPFVPQIAFTDFKIFSESVPIGGKSPLTKHISETDEVTLAYWQNDISFEFVALHYGRPENNRYACMLENYDQAWREMGTQRTATYTNLDPGEYTFRVKGSNNDGVWNETGTSIKIIITPPFWKTTWFKGVSVLFVAGLGFLLYEGKLKNERMKAELRAAHDAQMSIMPQKDPIISGMEVSGTCIPANQVGGDFFDYVWLDEEKTKLGVAVGDVSGKAIDSAMTAVMTDGMVVLEASRAGSIKEIVRRVNRSMYQKTDRNMFTALCLTSLDLQSKELTYTNAGLNEPLLKLNGTVEFLKGNGSRFPVGAFEDTEYEETRIKLEPRSVVIFFTDGIPEAQNRARELYGEDRLKSLLTTMDTSGLSAREIRDRILGDVRTFSGSAHQHDDMTVVVVRNS